MLETPASEDALWLARGEEVNPLRPCFTGDVLALGGEGGPLVMVLAHPCSMRGKGGTLASRVLVAPVATYSNLPLRKWDSGHFAVFPTAGLLPTPHAVRFDDLTTAPSGDLGLNGRIACLSVVGINLLQQRLVFHLTRAEVPTWTFNTAFQHTYDEADLLEEWVDELHGGAWSVEHLVAQFEERMRRSEAGAPSLQADLQDPQRRAAVTRSVRAMIKRIVGGIEAP